MHTYMPLKPSTDPHNDWWDAADTRARRSGHMYNFPLGECISQAEAATTTKSSGKDDKGYVKIEEQITFSASVPDIADARRRLLLFWTLAY